MDLRGFDKSTNPNFRIPVKYARYAIATKLRVVETTRNDKLRDDRDLTLSQLGDMLEHGAGLRVTADGKNHVDGACLTMKQLHQKPQYMNTMANKFKRHE
ncbi:hypothetical protein PPTG_21019 [Phytophthora nicotianae INRA-310]|uniref:Uncharacterized protein n=1 Tax=Phytophthora nicotianae (strain INRA-310) TaxID=761204 RepID=W2R845_PHYN3|nr:hypothetical protein PPTG_21019 [Phytophthora nicotianae INRA-310]ETN20859.1 hypothetical protein PPTG_21019 [Phytophthora nicotianae INRA-310]